MPRAPGADEERNLPPRFVGVPCMNVHHDAGIVPDRLGDAPVLQEQGYQLVQESRLGETYAHGHRIADYRTRAERFRWTKVGLVTATRLRPRTSLPRLADRPGTLRRSASAPRPAGAQRAVVGDLVDIATRNGGGIEVALIWNREEESLVVFAYDALTSEEVAIAVTGAEATEVYEHPFAYAHRSTRRLRIDRQAWK
jgi:hypothetical protein